MINVNMIPNNDIPVLHCSQGDTEERKFEVAVHSNGKMIDTSAIGKQTIYPVYAGGTEQILPVNESVPVTAPILADIEYPDELRTDQEFLYRQVPSTLDGNAKIRTIYGNSIVWNQQVTGTLSSRVNRGLTWVAADGIYTASGTATATFSVCDMKASNNYKPNIVAGHKYYFHASDTTKEYRFFSFDSNDSAYNEIQSGNVVTINNVDGAQQIRIMGLTSGTTVNATSNFILIDLTQMFGSGSEPTAQEFEALFNLPYYSYDTGSLLSFKGTDIKTINANLWDEQWELGYYSINDGAKQSSSSSIRSKNMIQVLPGQLIRFFNGVVSNTASIGIICYDINKNFLDGLIYYGINRYIDLIMHPKTCYINFYINDMTEYDNSVTVSYASYNLTNYVKHKERTVSLPVLDRFPTGMKSAGNVYDELTESKTITRVGAVDLGSLSWARATAGSHYRWTASLGAKSNPDNTPVSNITTTLKVDSANNIANGLASNLSLAIDVSGRIMISTDGIYTLGDFVSLVSGIIIHYELATPTEQEFTTVSLVGENGEMAGYVEDDKLMFNCNAEISSQPGVFPVKIKLQDDDGIAYSSLIKLMVEEQP